MDARRCRRGQSLAGRLPRQAGRRAILPRPRLPALCRAGAGVRPAAKDFEAAGISLLAISSDDAAGLKQSIENYKAGPLPIPLVADSTLDTFKAYRCFDDFEQQPLHGTFFIDGDGLVRWQDIGYEPFMDHKFLLGEAQRLLKQSAVSQSPGPATVPPMAAE